MNCSTCEAPFEPGRLFCMNCGATSPEGERVMGLRSSPGYQEPASAVTVEALPSARAEVTPPQHRDVSSLQPTSISAVVSFILGCVAWFGVPILGAMGAVISGHFARREIRLSGGRLAGGGFATAGLVLGYTQIFLVAVIVVLIMIGIGAAIAFS